MRDSGGKHGTLPYHQLRMNGKNMDETSNEKTQKLKYTTVKHEYICSTCLFQATDSTITESINLQFRMNSSLLILL